MSFQSSGSVIVLASFPGSGNSWVRQLLESATGIYTGALYCDGAYVRAGMIAWRSCIHTKCYSNKNS